jgi:hypothetical protein
MREIYVPNPAITCPDPGGSIERQTRPDRCRCPVGTEQLGLSETLAWTATENRRVMEKIGMKDDPSGDFDHPRLPRGPQFERNVLYRNLEADK